MCFRPWAKSLPMFGPLLALSIVCAIMGTVLVWFIVPVFLVSPGRNLGNYTSSNAFRTTASFSGMLLRDCLLFPATEEELLIWSYMLIKISGFVVFVMWALNESGYRELTANVESSIMAQTALKRGDHDRLEMLAEKEAGFKQRLVSGGVGGGRLSPEECAEVRARLGDIAQEREGLVSTHETQDTHTHTHTHTHTYTHARQARACRKLIYMD